MSPKFRQMLYSIGVIAFAALSLLSTFKLLDPNTAATISAALTSVLGLFGVTGFGVAAYQVTKQQHGGAFDPASPADQVIAGVNAVIANAQQAKAEVDRVQDVLGQAVKDIPALGPLAKQAIDAVTPPR